MTVNATATKSVDFQRMRLLFLVREFTGLWRWDIVDPIQIQNHYDGMLKVERYKNV